MLVHGTVFYREQTKADVEELCTEKETLKSKLRSLESDFEETKASSDRDRTALLAKLEQAESETVALQQAHTTALKRATAFQQAKEKGDNVCDELKKEAEYIMTDLEEANSRLREAEQERDKAIHHKDKVMNELAKRNRDIQLKEEQITKLEGHLKVDQEKITILDIQVYTVEY